MEIYQEKPLMAITLMPSHLIGATFYNVRIFQTCTVLVDTMFISHENAPNVFKDHEVR